MPLEQANPNEVPAEAAYAAAEERAVKTTRALILAEAQVLTLGRRVQQLEDECFDLRRRLEDATAPDEQGEVTHDATEDDANRSSTGGEARTAHDFSD
jgi:hypothetical protein